MPTEDKAPRYDGLAQLLHWTTTAALFLMLPFVWVAENFPEGPMRVFWYLLHESVGICIFLLVVVRVTRRFVRPPPGPADRRGTAPHLLAGINHWLLYAVLLIMPVTGYMMAGNGQGIPFFGILNLPGFPKNDALGVWANSVHIWTQFVVYALVMLHIAGTVWHIAIRRDALLDRMLPPQDRQCKPVRPATGKLPML